MISISDITRIIFGSKKFSDLDRQHQALVLVFYAHDVVYTKNNILERLISTEEIQRALIVHDLESLPESEFQNLITKLQSNMKYCESFINSKGVLFNETVH
jgi:hypothetical protein